MLLLERDYKLTDSFGKQVGQGITLSVHGTLGISELTGGRTIEDMKVCIGDKDIYNELTESVLMDLESELFNES